MDALKIFLIISLSFFFLQTQGQTQYARVTKNTSLKTDNSSESKTITRLSKNEELIFLDNCGRYYCKVELNGKIGWVKKHLLEFDLNPPAQVKPKEEELTSVETLSLEDSSKEHGQNTSSPNNSSTSFPYLIILLGLLFIGALSYLSYKLYQKIQIIKQEKIELSQKAEQEKSVLESEFQQFKSKYQGIVDIEKEVSINKKEVIELKKSQNEIRTKYHKALEVYKHLEHESNLLKNDLEIAEFGVYEPQFDYETSAIFKLKIKENRAKQKELISQDLAIQGGTGWQVNGSLSKGISLIKKQKKLMLRALNGECDNFIKSVKWNNETRMEERILKSAEIISRIGDSQGLKVSDEFVKLKLLELRLTHEAALKKHEEKEIQREIREKIRDEEKARKEYEKALRDTEKEEKLLHDAMKKAREQMEKSTASERALFESRLLDLQGKLKEAEEKNQRAISMAQQTKAGHVYVISNIGSFGENVFKIGMTRRLEPLDRIYELGDASVPFRFDVHAMIYSENAPELENQLHKKFDRYRINHVNRRREYFNVSLEEIEKVVKENHGEIEFVIEPEAKEYRESLVIKQQFFSRKKESIKKVNMEFPAEI